MITMFRAIVAIICAMAMLWPREALAVGQMSLGLGYIKGDCQLPTATDEAGAGSPRCFTGLRLETLVSFYHQDADSKADDGGKSIGLLDGENSSGSGTNWNLGHIGGGRDAEALLIIIAVVLLLFGIYWTIGALASQKLKLGLYYSHDFQTTRWSGQHGGDTYETFEVERAGIQAGFYLIPDVDVQIHTGVGPATARIASHGDSSSDHLYVKGISTKAGIGWVPSADSGPFALYEMEGTFISSGSLARYVRESSPLRLPSLRRSGAVMAGYTFAF